MSNVKSRCAPVANGGEVNRKMWPLLFSVGRMFVLLATSTVFAANSSRPNILFICTDDQAAWAIGVSGNQQAVTPHMDRLASQSAYLSNAFVSTPVCSPSRAATLTGRYGYEVGVFNWMKSKNLEDGLDPHALTFSEVLRDAGYRTGLVGKWHLGMHDRFYPPKHGFDYFMGHRFGHFRTRDPTLEVSGTPTKLQGLTADVLADDVIRFMRDHAENHANAPFLLNWHTRAPHTRWLPVAAEDMEPYSADKHVDIPSYPELDVDRVDQMMREYLASVRSVDRNLGRVMKALHDLKLTDNTVVVFTSDHGYNVGHHGIWHKGNGIWVLNRDVPATHNVAKNKRPNMWDNSIRVPTLVRWPGVAEPGSVIPQTTSNLDWFPTILELAGIDVPAGKILRGRSIVPLLRGSAADEWDNDFFGFYSSSYPEQFVEEMRMMRTPKWKLVRYLRAPERDELFDLVHDPSENKNLMADVTAEREEIVKLLQGKLVARMRACQDPALELVRSD